MGARLGALCGRSRYSLLTLAKHAPQEFATISETNFTSTFALCQQLKPLLARAAQLRGRASVVFNSSVAGVVAISSGSIYAATKVRVLPAIFDALAPCALVR